MFSLARTLFLPRLRRRSLFFAASEPQRSGSVVDVFKSKGLHMLSFSITHTIWVHRLGSYCPGFARGCPCGGGPRYRYRSQRHDERGGGGVTYSGFLPVLLSPPCGDFEDNTIGGNVTISGWQSCWLGAFRDTCPSPKLCKAINRVP